MVSHGQGFDRTQPACSDMKLGDAGSPCSATASIRHLRCVAARCDARPPCRRCLIRIGVPPLWIFSRWRCPRHGERLDNGNGNLCSSQAVPPVPVQTIPLLLMAGCEYNSPSPFLSFCPYSSLDRHLTTSSHFILSHPRLLWSSKTRLSRAVRPRSVNIALR